MFKSHFDILPQKLVVLITSKLDVHYKVLEDVSSDFRKFIQDDNTYKNLLFTVDPKFHDFIGTVKNIDGSDTWKNIYTYYIKGSDTTEYCENLYYSYKIYSDFPHIYKYIFNINLNHPGVQPYGNFKWKYIYDMSTLCADLRFIKGEYSAEVTMELFLKLQMLSYTMGMTQQLKFFGSIIVYIGFINRDLIPPKPSVDEVIDVVYAQFLLNEDMYENVLATMDIGQFLKDSTTKETFGRIPDSDERLRYQMFIDDLKSRV